MSRSLFIGDSHTVGYKTIEGQVGPGSFTFWNDNNYAVKYSEIHNKDIIIYAQPGATTCTQFGWLICFLNITISTKCLFVWLR